MADVQLEHGHVRIANRLFEAILDADFTGAQSRILVALVRLTYGWRRRTVTVTVPELAAYCRLQPVGGFRRALRDLVREGVVLQLDFDKGRLATTYAIQKDFTAWGRYSVAEARLAAVWGGRPKSDDALLSEHPVSPPNAEDGPTEVTPSGETPQGHNPTGSDSTTPQGQTGEPHRVIPSTPNPLSDGDVGERKDSERQGKTVTPHTDGANADAEAALRTAMGADMAAVDRFLATRPLRSRANWYPELLRIIGPAMSAKPADLAGACTDALIVDPPVTTPHALRTFVQKQMQVRTAAVIARIPRTPAGREPREARDASATAEPVRVEAGNLVASIRELIFEQNLPGQGSRKLLRNADVERMGDDVSRAYRTVGGAARFIKLDTKPEDLPFLIRDFGDALQAARAQLAHPEVQSA